MRVTLLAAVAVLALAPQSQAARSCTVLADPAGDVALEGAPLPVEDGHVDLRDVTLAITARTVTVTFHDTALDGQRRGNWRLTFTIDGKRAFVEAGRGMWANAGHVDGLGGYRAGLVDGRAADVAGTYDTASSRVTVRAPAALFGRITRTTALTSFAATVTETYVHTDATAMRLVDTASSRGAVRAGSCG